MQGRVCLTQTTESINWQGESQWIQGVEYNRSIEVVQVYYLERMHMQHWFDVLYHKEDDETWRRYTIKPLPFVWHRYLCVIRRVQWNHCGKLLHVLVLGSAGLHPALSCCRSRCSLCSVMHIIYNRRLNWLERAYIRPVCLSHVTFMVRAGILLNSRRLQVLSVPVDPNRLCCVCNSLHAGWNLAIPWYRQYTYWHRPWNRE